MSTKEGNKTIPNPRAVSFLSHRIFYDRSSKALCLLASGSGHRLFIPSFPVSVFPTLHEPRGHAPLWLRVWVVSVAPALGQNTHSNATESRRSALLSGLLGA